MGLGLGIEGWGWGWEWRVGVGVGDRVRVKARVRVGTKDRWIDIRVDSQQRTGKLAIRMCSVTNGGNLCSARPEMTRPPANGDLSWG